MALCGPQTRPATCDVPARPAVWNRSPGRRLRTMSEGVTDAARMDTCHARPGPAALPETLTPPRARRLLAGVKRQPSFGQVHGTRRKKKPLGPRHPGLRLVPRERGASAKRSAEPAFSTNRPGKSKWPTGLSVAASRQTASRWLADRWAGRGHLSPPAPGSIRRARAGGDS